MRIHSRAGRLLAGLLSVALAALCPPAAAVGEAQAVYGDLNGDAQVDASDALLVLQHSVNLAVIEDGLKPMADVDESGAIDATDALSILQKSVELIDVFPAEEGNAIAQTLDGLFLGATIEVVDEEAGVIGEDIAMYNADMVWVGNTLYAYYPGTGGIRLATSSDGVDFADAGVVVPANEEFWSVGGADNPSVFVDNGRFYLAYDAYNASGQNSICLATSDDGRSFISEGRYFSFILVWSQKPSGFPARISSRLATSGI